MKRKIGWGLLAGVLYLPFAYLLLLSFADAWRFPDAWPTGLSVAHWQALRRAGSGLGESWVRSVLLSATVAALATGSGFWVSRAIATHPRKTRWLTLAYFPYAFSPVVYAFCLNYAFLQMGASGTLWGVGLAQWLLTFPFAVLLFVPHWSPTLLSMGDLVRTLGGTKRQAFWQVTLPLSKTILGIAFFQTFLISWFEYGLTSVIGLGKVQTLTIQTYQYIGEANVYFAALASVMLTFPPLVMGWALKRGENL